MKRLVFAAGFLAVLKTLEEDAQAGYFLLPKRLEMAARYSSIDPNRDRSIHIQQAVGKQPTDNKQMRVQAQLAF